MIRSMFANILFYIITPIIFLMGLPLLFFKRDAMFWLAKTWSDIILAMMRFAHGITFEVRGLENLPDLTKPHVFAPKHQSTWDMFGLVQLVRRPIFAYKGELIFVPVLGMLLYKADQIRLRRGTRRAALESLVEGAGPCFERGDNLVVFPEGTRRDIDDPHVYKYGLSYLYENKEVTVIPVALNAGLFWPRRSFTRYPGTIIMEVLPAIPPNLPTTEFEARLQAALNEATDRLIKESRDKGEGKPFKKITPKK